MLALTVAPGIEQSARVEDLAAPVGDNEGIVPLEDWPAGFSCDPDDIKVVVDIGA